jgi:hypothetical protein
LFSQTAESSIKSKCFETLAANEALAVVTRVSTSDSAIKTELEREAQLQKRYQDLQVEKARLWALLQ